MVRELTGGIAVVTGAASGIGRALAHRLAADGMSVVLADVEADTLEGVAAELRATYGERRILAEAVDVADPVAMAALAEHTVHRFGAVHVVCNNAGVGSGGRTWEVDPEVWRWVVDVNLLGVVNGIRAFVPHLLRQRWGHVLNTASAAGLLSGVGMAPYFATKHAVVALSESLHLDLRNARSNVGVTVVCPEWVRGTRIHDAERNRPGDREEGATSVVGGILGSLVSGGTDPDDLARQCADAVREDRFWVLPHRDTTLEAARQRWRAIEDDAAPTSWDFGVRRRPGSPDATRRGRRRRPA